MSILKIGSPNTPNVVYGGPLTVATNDSTGLPRLFSVPSTTLVTITLDGISTGTVSCTAHGLLAGDVFAFTATAGTIQFSNGVQTGLNGVPFRVKSVTDANTFTFYCTAVGTPTAATGTLAYWYFPPPGQYMLVSGSGPVWRWAFANHPTMYVQDQTTGPTFSPVLNNFTPYGNGQPQNPQWQSTLAISAFQVPMLVDGVTFAVQQAAVTGGVYMSLYRFG